MSARRRERTPPLASVLLGSLLICGLDTCCAGIPLGIDLGGHNSIVATARRGGIDVLVNEASKRQTPSVVAFDERQRLLGQSASTQQARSPSDCVADIKALLGIASLEAAQLVLRQPSAPLIDGDGAAPLVEVRLRGEARHFSATQLLAMLLHNLQRTAERETSDAVTECTIAVPLYFTAAQRRAVLDAAEIAGLKTCRLISDGAAAALDYALSRADLPVDEDHTVAIVDVGHLGAQVCVVAIRKDSLRILSHAYAPNVGGAVRAHRRAHAPSRIHASAHARHALRRSRSGP